MLFYAFTVLLLCSLLKCWPPLVHPHLSNAVLLLAASTFHLKPTPSKKSDQLLRPVDQSMKVASQLGQEPRMPDQLFQPDDQILGDMKPVKSRKAYDSAYEAFSKHASLEPGQAPTEELRPLFSFLMCNTSCQCRTSTPALKAHFGWSMERL